MRRRMIGLAVVAVASWAWTAIAAAPATRPSPIVVPLWEHGVPDAAAHPGPERDDGTGRIWNVSVPTMLVYLPPGGDDRPRMAIVFCPGGGYTHLTRLEGADGLVQECLPRGVVVVALKYRLRPASADVERDARADAQQAIRLLRRNATVWNIDPHRIGLLGASAGANVVLNVVSHATPADPTARQSGKPDFACLLSPWPDGHPIADYPLGKDPPPAFIASARDDHTAPTAFAEAIAAEYQAAGAQHALWLIDEGGHAAFTLGGPGEGSHWSQRFWAWLRHIGMTP